MCSSCHQDNMHNIGELSRTHLNLKYITWNAHSCSLSDSMILKLCKEWAFIRFQFDISFGCSLFMATGPGISFHYQLNRDHLPGIPSNGEVQVGWLWRHTGTPAVRILPPNASETHLNWNFSILIHPELFFYVFQLWHKAVRQCKIFKIIFGYRSVIMIAARIYLNKND